MLTKVTTSLSFPADSFVHDCRLQSSDFVSQTFRTVSVWPYYNLDKQVDYTAEISDTDNNFC